jgi:hypothetical protein
VSKYFGIALAIGSLAISGCSSTVFKPFDADKNSVSMDARQRTIVSVDRGTPGQPRRIVCAEPSPDALATIAASAAGSAGVSGIPQVPGSAEIAASMTSAEQAAMIGARNSTIQLLRDGLYRACEAYMNGALGDFGYGLVLANYGRVMVALLTADGLVRPALVPPVVIGSVTGNVTTSAEGSASGMGAKKDGTKDAAPTDGNSPNHVAKGEATGGTELKAADKQDSQPGQINGDQAVRIFENVVFPLANPTADPAGKFMEVAVACMIWLDNSGLKQVKLTDNPLQNSCAQIVQGAPQIAEPAIIAKLIALYGPNTVKMAAAAKAPTTVAFKP